MKAKTLKRSLSFINSSLIVYFFAKGLNMKNRVTIDKEVLESLSKIDDEFLDIIRDDNRYDAFECTRIQELLECSKTVIEIEKYGHNFDNTILEDFNSSVAKLKTSKFKFEVNEVAPYNGDVLQEAFFSTKHPNLVEIESILTKMKTLRGSHFGSGADLLKIENLFEEMLNIKKLILVIDESTVLGGALEVGNFNAYTPVNGTIMEYARNLERIKGAPYIITKNNSYWVNTEKPDGVITVVVTSDMLIALSPQETIGVILHEIGHNLMVYAKSLRMSGYLVTVLSIMFAMMVVSNKPTIIAHKVFQYISKILPDKFVQIIGGIFDLMSGVVTWMVSSAAFLITLASLAAMIASIPLLPLTTFLSVIATLVGGTTIVFGAATLRNLVLYGNSGRASEDFADSFAASYGYGEALIAGLNKITSATHLTKMIGMHDTNMHDTTSTSERARRSVIKNKVLDKSVYILTNVTYIARQYLKIINPLRAIEFLIPLNPHPTVMERLSNVRKTLVFEKSRSTGARKEAIESQIANIDKLGHEMATSYKGKGSGGDILTLRKKVHTLVDDLVGNGNIYKNFATKVDTNTLDAEKKK